MLSCVKLDSSPWSKYIIDDAKQNPEAAASEPSEGRRVAAAEESEG